MGDRINAIGAYDSCEFSSPIEYTFNLIFSMYGISYYVTPLGRLKSADYDVNKTLIISYGKKYLDAGFRNRIHIYASDLFGEDYLKPDSMPKVSLKSYGELPVVYYGSADFDGFVRKSKNLIEANVDIIASSFFMLSRYEEVVLNDKKDRFSRFPATESLAYKEGFLDRPIVNEYIELLWSWIDSFGLGFKRRKLWGDKDFAVCLTHDVDTVKKYKIYPPVQTIGSLVLKHRDFKKAFAITTNYLKAKLSKDPYDNFTYIMDLEAKYGFKSSFYFMSGGTTEYDATYSIDEPYVISLIKTLQEKGFEIGLHPSFNSYNNFQILDMEKKRLEAVIGDNILGVRQHYLRWKMPDTWRILEKTGLKYDVTLSFADHEGFRCGICFPYKPFDILENRILNIWELPLTVMDGSLFNYQNLTSEEGFERIKNLIDTTKKYNGLFILLWHNSSLDRLELPEWIKTYERTMEYLGKQNLFNDTAQRIIDWREGNVLWL